MKIDAFSHILPRKYVEVLKKKAKPGSDFTRGNYWVGDNPAATDVEIRMRAMERYPDVLQILTVATPPLETYVTTPDAIELSRIANDEMAELVAKYPNKFAGAVACLPLSSIDASIEELDRAITKLNFRGIQIFSEINGEHVDEPKFRPLFERMAYHDLPIWIHPWYTSMLDTTEPGLHWFGRAIETSCAMVRLAQSGVFEAFPNIKFITHHCGGIVPYQVKRIRTASIRNNLAKFYADTMVDGNTPALLCGSSFFGIDHILFGTDAPLGAGSRIYGLTLEIIKSIERMQISEEDKNKIFLENAINLLKLKL